VMFLEYILLIIILTIIGCLLCLWKQLLLMNVCDRYFRAGQLGCRPILLFSSFVFLSVPVSSDVWTNKRLN